MWSKVCLLKKDTMSQTHVLQEITAFLGNFQNLMQMEEKTYLHFLSLVTPLMSNNQE